MKALLQKIDTCLSQIASCCSEFGKCLRWVICCGWCTTAVPTEVERAVPQTNLTELQEHSLSEIQVDQLSGQTEDKLKSDIPNVRIVAMGAENKIKEQACEQSQTLPPVKRTEIDKSKITAKLEIKGLDKQFHTLVVRDNIITEYQFNEVCVDIDPENFSKEELQSIIHMHLNAQIEVEAALENAKQLWAQAAERKVDADGVNGRVSNTMLSAPSLSSQKPNILTFSADANAGNPTAIDNLPNTVPLAAVGLRVCNTPGILDTKALDKQINENFNREPGDLAVLRVIKAGLKKQELLKKKQELLKQKTAEKNNTKL